MYFLNVLLINSSIISIFLAIYVLKYRKYSGSLYFSLLMLGSSLYSLGYSFELSSETINQVHFWGKIEYIGILLIPVAWLFLAVQFCGKMKYFYPPIQLITILIPITTYILYLTNDMHHYFYKSISLKQINSLTIIFIEKGFAYYIHIAFSYACILGGSFLFIRLLWSDVKAIKYQAIFIVSGCFVTWIADVISVLGLSPLNIDLGTLSLTITGLIFLFGMFRFHLFEVVPIAFENVFMSMSDAIIVIDDKYRIINSNPSARRLLNELHIDKNNTLDLRLYPPILKLVTTNTDEVKQLNYNIDNEDKYFRVSVSEIIRKNYRIGKIVTFSDISEQKKIEANLRKSEETLKTLNVTKSRFFSIISHDLRGPIGNISALLNFAKDNDDMTEETLHEYISTVADTAKTTYELLNNLLSWSRLQLDELTYLPARYSVWETAEAALNPLLGMAKSKDINIQNEIPDNLFGLFDFDMITTVFRNFTNNAIKFTHPQGCVILRARIIESHIEVAIKDSGIGMDKNLMDKLFKLDVKISSLAGTKNEKGSGLGLILCKDFVEKNNGTVGVKSELGIGSTFFFTIPLFIPR